MEVGSQCKCLLYRLCINYVCGRELFSNGGVIHIDIDCILSYINIIIMHELTCREYHVVYKAMPYYIYSTPPPPPTHTHIFVILIPFKPHACTVMHCHALSCTVLQVIMFHFCCLMNTEMAYLIVTVQCD